MNRKILMMLMALSLCFIYGCGTNNSLETSVDTSAPESITYQKISAEQAKNMMNENDEYILLDVRTDEEFNEKRIADAILIPDYETTDRAETELANKDALILVYCRSGRRSAIAANELLELGYTNVFDFGGIIDWPYDTISG